MTLASLTDVLPPARAGGYAVAGLVCLGWEEARAAVTAAEAATLPVILLVGPKARAAMPLAAWGGMLRPLAEAAQVPVVLHLDHGRDLAECQGAIACGFTSVMYDGSRDPLETNIADTAAVAKAARAAGVSSEGEIGFVGYDAGEASRGTDPDEAARFARETGVDAVAVSVGNVHLRETGAHALDWARLRAIEAATDAPLVIHGGSGLSTADRARLAGETAVCKVNIGTELRQSYGRALRATLAADADLYDRLEINARVLPDLVAAAGTALRSLHPTP